MSKGLIVFLLLESLEIYYYILWERKSDIMQKQDMKSNIYFQKLSTAVGFKIIYSAVS